MQQEPDKLSSYYHSSSKPSFVFYRTTVIVSMVALLGVLGVNLYTLNQQTSTNTRAAEPTPTGTTALVTPTNAITPEPTSLNGQARPPLPQQCHYESENVIICTEGGKSCTYKIVNDKYAMECN